MFFSEDKISEIIEKNDIVDVISEYMSLKKSGNNYVALCPFHSEKTPSFSVSSTKQIFYCFGCGTGGNVVTFVQKIEKLNYVEALKLLAEKARIDIEETKNDKELEKINLKKTLYKLNSDAARFFYNKLSESSPPMKYLTGRGVSEAIIKKFGLGYSTPDWRDLMQYLLSKGYQQKEIYAAGLISKNQEGSNYFDKFRNRIMFPIIDLKGNVIAFGGRVMDESKPKYLNSPDTPIFNKGYNIFALNFAKKTQNLENLIIVEGYMDAITLHQYGVTNAVASLGTAFTENQAKLLKRFSNEIIISYDSDLAGQNATQKGLNILEKEGCVVRVLTLPSGKDPDEYIRKEGLEAFHDRVKKSISLIEYKIEAIKKRLDINNLQDRITFTKQFSLVLMELESNVEIDAYVKKYSKNMQISEEAIYAELNRLKSKHKNGNNQHNIIDNHNNADDIKKGELIAEIYLINMCIDDKQKAKTIFERIEPSDFSNELHFKIAQILNFKIKEGKLIMAGEIINCFENEEEKAKVVKIFSYQLPDEIDDEFIYSSIKKVKQTKLNRKIQELINEMNAYYQTNEKEQANKIYNEIVDLQKRKM